jgi:hypothetical protein
MAPNGPQSRGDVRIRQEAKPRTSSTCRGEPAVVQTQPTLPPAARAECSACCPPARSRTLARRPACARGRVLRVEAGQESGPANWTIRSSVSGGATQWRSYAASIACWAQHPPTATLTRSPPPGSGTDPWGRESAVKSPGYPPLSSSRVKQTERARVPADQRLALQTNASGNRVAIMPVAARDIVGWEGVDTHKLFKLNVRGGGNSGEIRSANNSTQPFGVSTTTPTSWPRTTG